MSTAAPRSRRLVIVPVAAAAVVAAAVAVPMVARADPSLPTKSAAQLLAEVSSAQGTPLSGTVVETARLGLPALPQTGDTSISPTALLAGSHTARVWTDGATKARVALVANLAETDLIRNGRDVWLWTSGKNTAQHAVLPAAKSPAGTATPGPESLTPQAAAQRALAAIDPTTKVSVDGTARVAGRSAYELVLQPRDTRSLIGSVRIAVDSKTHVPLRVQVDAAGSTGRPAFETAFTSVTFAKPAASVFTFTPPPGARVSELGGTRDGTAHRPGTTTQRSAPRTIGTGWTTIVEVPSVTLPTAGQTGGDRSQASEALAALTRSLRPVAGGRALRTALVSVLLTDDGRMLVGAVPTSMLVQAAAQ